MQIISGTNQAEAGGQSFAQHVLQVNHTVHRHQMHHLFSILQLLWILSDIFQAHLQALMVLMEPLVTD